MTFKERMRLLDDIGFIGTQEKISPAKRKEMIKQTAEFIRAHRESIKKGKKRKAA